MVIKIVGGSAKGRILKGPKKAAIRPATSQVRNSVFNILRDISDFNVLDLFAGSGSMGIEALSWGADHCTFVDINSEAHALLQHNLSALNFLDQATLIKYDVIKAIATLAARHAQYDLIFVDPPYDQALVKATFDALAKHPLHHSNTQILCEHSPREKLDLPPQFEVVDERHYGQTLVSFIKSK